MGDRLDDFVDQLQTRIFQETRAAYGELGFERWRNPRYAGALPDADGHGRLTGSCGDTMQIFLKYENEKVLAASYLTDGCGASAVCGSLAAELALGKNADELSEITGDTILDLLGTFPQEDRHCAFLAAQTLQEAVGDYIQRQLRLKNSGPSAH